MKPGTRFAGVWLLAALALPRVTVAQVTQLQRFNFNDGINGLYRTNDNGKTWSEMALPDAAETSFFLNSTTGWALITGDSGEANPSFALGTTHDSGATWTIHPIDVHVDPKKHLLPGQGHLQFTDEMHGWINLLVQSGSAFDFGILLKTVDGGKTWTRAGGPGTSEEMRFINAQDGWQLGPHQTELWVTHDGSRTWHKVPVKTPPGAGPADEATYLLPLFGDEKHGAFEVAFSGLPTAPKEACHNVLYVTSDGGRHWNMRQVQSKQDSCGSWWPYTAAGSFFITPSVSNGKLTLKKVSLKGASATTETTADPDFFVYPGAITFSSPSDGWASVTACCEAACPTCALKPSTRVSCVANDDEDRPMGRQCGALLSTNDGGKTWTDITLRQTCVLEGPTGPKHCTVEK